MIFTELLNQKTEELTPEFDRLFEYALEKQNHSGNLLLFHVNGFYDEDISESNIGLDPYLIGPGYIGHSEIDHYKFVKKYIGSCISNFSYENYIKELDWSQEKNEQIDQMIDMEETTIQLEMLIYLKFWEADMIIKKFYQLVNVLMGENYDWHFKISNSLRDQNTTGSRQDIIRKKIRDRIKNNFPILYKYIKEAYKTQIRNSIAHSNYFFLNRTIHLNNYIKDDIASQLKSISFNEWIDIFHNTLSIYKEYIKFENRVNDFYGKQALEKDLTIPILVTKRSGVQNIELLEYRESFRDWHYKN